VTVSKEKSEKRPLRAGLISLGCAKNLVDGEIMLGTLLKGGVEVTNDAATADVMIVNSCSFIDSAQEESVDTILEAAQVREARNRGQAIIVAGCLPQRFREELPKLLPEVDAFVGIDQVAHITELVREAAARRAERVHSPNSKVQSRVPPITHHASRITHPSPIPAPGPWSASPPAQPSSLTNSCGE
jgi:ribosomal protein S12 methylthiotransferase